MIDLSFVIIIVFMYYEIWIGGAMYNIVIIIKK